MNESANVWMKEWAHYTNRGKKNQGNPYRWAAKVLGNRRHDALIKEKQTEWKIESLGISE